MRLEGETKKGVQKEANERESKNKLVEEEKDQQTGGARGEEGGNTKDTHRFLRSTARMLFVYFWDSKSSNRTEMMGVMNRRGSREGGREERVEKERDVRTMCDDEDTHTKQKRNLTKKAPQRLNCAQRGKGNANAKGKGGREEVLRRNDKWAASVRDRATSVDPLSCLFFSLTHSLSLLALLDRLLDVQLPFLSLVHSLSLVCVCVWGGWAQHTTLQSLLGSLKATP